MRDKKIILTINGKDAELFYRKSRSKKQNDKAIYTLAVLNVVDELIKGYDRDFKHAKGITTLQTITSYDEPRLNIKRLSNKIIELRKILDSAILTFKYLDDFEYRYGVIKEAKNIELLLKLRENIASKLSEKETQKSRQKRHL